MKVRSYIPRRSKKTSKLCYPSGDITREIRCLELFTRRYFCSISTSDYKQYHCQPWHMEEATQNQQTDTTKLLRSAGEGKEISFNRIIHLSDSQKFYNRIVKAGILFLNDKTGKDSAGDDKICCP